MDPSQFSDSTRAELNFVAILNVGSKGPAVRRVQEWLSLHGFGTAIDGDFGSATGAALNHFKAVNHLPPNGTVDRDTWAALVAPMTVVLQGGIASTLPQRIEEVANRHLASKAREVGGDNCGPWVRLYTGGHEGTEWKWCAGFVSFILKQATTELQCAMPVPGSLSCDSLAAQGDKAGRLIKGSTLGPGQWQRLGPTYIFLVRRTDSDWMHTGLGFDGQPDHFDTIEGNTNDDGSANGYEVAARVRSAKEKDFIVVQ
ncbi:peptidoglycan-binding domain-containing protein [Paraburkholderia humisilvae]|uniref:Peptidoglycan binding-like domain-containing protein n=1 Tax=Paraburkholderia humisilvae TaxID=627669 RepID=A0A6J5CXW9_9BURK|nr:peptidoglycan-binding domain-containing protein [Paraburkholderia humisilvae]CAB3745695.1 hypothetical protein LMG29542_00020 [Paraburkholderia humisilvae]